MIGTEHPSISMLGSPRRRGGGLVALVAALVALAGCGGGGAPQESVAGETRMERAAEIWDRKCLACHGARGGGGVGPNLTDRYWLHGGSPEEIRRSIAKGFPMKGMIAYENDLSPAEIDALVDYVLEMQGTDPPNAMPPQGEPVE
jgi:mono/diheme cytochrome c family protein